MLLSYLKESDLTDALDDLLLPKFCDILAFLFVLGFVSCIAPSLLGTGLCAVQRHSSAKNVCSAEMHHVQTSF